MAELASVKPPTKVSGYSRATKPTIPISSKGAVSPKACANPMIVPVRMPGIASGSTWWNTDCILEAPTPKAASRIDGGTAASEARVEMMIVGSVISVRTRPPTSGADCGKPANWMNTARPRIPNTMEGTAARFEMFTSIRVGPAVLGGEFLKVDGGGHPDGQRQKQNDKHHKERADHRRAQARPTGVIHARVCARNKVPVERAFDDARVLKRVHQIKVSCHQEPTVHKRIAGYPAIEIAINTRGRGQLKRHGCADAVRGSQGKSCGSCRPACQQAAGLPWRQMRPPTRWHQAAQSARSRISSDIRRS